MNNLRIEHEYFELFVEEKSAYNAHFFPIIVNAVEKISIIFKTKPEKKIPIIFASTQECEIRDGTIFIGTPLKKGTSLSDTAWCELLFTHELSHWFIQYCWKGMGPALFWEGLPIYLADNRVRTRVLGYSYDDIAKALQVCRHLIPLKELIDATHFYSRRSDWRVDVLAGSFTGFLFRNYPLPAIQLLYSCYSAPTVEKPLIEFSTLIENSLGVCFDDIEETWGNFLIHTVPFNRKAFEKVQQASFSLLPKEAITLHCQYCYTPLRQQETICPSCKHDNSMRVVVI